MTEFPLTSYLTYLLQSPRTRKEAGQEARRLGVRLDWAEAYFLMIGC